MEGLEENLWKLKTVKMCNTIQPITAQHTYLAGHYTGSFST